MSVSESPTEHHLLHFDLAAHTSDEAPLTLHVAQREYHIQPHSRHTLSASRDENGFLRLLPDHMLSHHVEASLPADAVALMWVTRPVLIDGYSAEQVVSMGIHVPRETRLRDVRRNLRAGAPGELHPKLGYRDLGRNLLLGENRLLAELAALEAAPDKIADYNDAYETAVALLFKHPELINLQTNAAQGGPVTVIEGCIRRALNKFNRLPQSILANAQTWSKLERADDDGKPAVDTTGQPVFVMTLHPDVAETIVKPLSLALVLANQAEELRGQNWSTQYGRTDAGYDGEVKPKRALRAAPRGAGDVRWKLKNLTPTNGLVFEPDVRFTPATAGHNWRAESVWSSSDQASIGPFGEDAQKALAAGNLYLRFDALSGVLTPVPGKAGRYSVELSAANSAKKASGECYLSSAGDALQYVVTSSDGPFQEAGFALGASSRIVHSVAVRQIGSNGNLMVVAKNHWLRHLACYVEFLDSGGTPHPPRDWSSRFPIPGLYDNHHTKRYVDMVGPVETMMGIPLPADSTHISVPVPSDAATVRFTWGGMGTGANDPVACPPGVIMTVVVEMALPTLLLVAGAALTASGGMMKLIRQKPVIGGLLLGFTEMYITFADDPAKAALTVGKKLIPVIAKAGLGQLSQFIAEKIAVGAAKKAVPFINVALFLADVAATAAQLAQTSSAVRQSPRAHITEITRSIDLEITITSSKLYHKFPDHHHHIGVVVTYDSGATLPALKQRLPDETLSDDIVVTFRDVPAGGNLRVLVFFYAENDWQSGQGASPWVKAEGSGGSATLKLAPIEIEINEIPLGKWSVYEHQEKIVMRDGQHVWQHAPPPPATKDTPSPIRGKITKLHAITMAQFPEMIGYAWTATDLNLPVDDPHTAPSAGALFTMQNLSVLQHPQKAYATPAVGFSDAGAIGYDVVAPDDGSGRNFVVDPSRGIYDEVRNRNGGYHLRRIGLKFEAVPVFPTGSGQSYGRFAEAIDQMVVHPHGYAFAIRRSAHKIFRIELPATGVPDAQAPLASLYSGEGTRDGLIKSPVAIALALDGRVLVLEAGNNRVQCFDTSGNPVRYFPVAGQTEKSPFMALQPGKFTLLDMAVEAKGHIFVLGYSGTGNKPGDYRMDLYDPAGTFLTATGNFTAARITVDLLRNLFALNYEVLQGTGGRPEPGISHWRAPAPPRQHS